MRLRLDAVNAFGPSQPRARRTGTKSLKAREFRLVVSKRCMKQAVDPVWLNAEPSPGRSTRSVTPSNCEVVDVKIYEHTSLHHTHELPRRCASRDQHHSRQISGVSTYVDALAALVPAEALTAHAAILTFTTDTVTTSGRPVVARQSTVQKVSSSPIHRRLDLRHFEVPAV